MSEELLKLINNPINANALSIGARAGDTVFAWKNQRLYQAIALHDINGANVVLTFVAEEQRYYALSPHATLSVTEETTELIRHKPVKKKLVEIVYIVVLRSPSDRVAKEIIDTGLNLFSAYLWSFLLSQTNSTIVTVDPFSIDLNVEYWENGILTQFQHTNFNALIPGTRGRYYILEQTKVAGFPFYFLPANVSSDLRLFITFEEGQPVDELIEATLTFTGTPSQQFTFNTVDPSSTPGTTVVDVFRQTIRGFSDYNEFFRLTTTGGNNDYYDLLLSEVNEQILADNFIGPFKNAPEDTVGYFLATELKLTSHNTSWERNYAYNNTDPTYPQFDYDYFTRIQSVFSADILGASLVNSGQVGPTGGDRHDGSYHTLIRGTWMSDFTESAASTEVALSVDLPPTLVSITPATINYTTTTRTTRTSEQEFDQTFEASQSGSSIVTEILDYTARLKVIWNLEFSYLFSQTYSNNFVYNSINLPITFNQSFILSYQDDFTFETIDTGTNPALDFVPMFPGMDRVYDSEKQSGESIPLSFTFAALDCRFNSLKTTSANMTVNKDVNLVKIMTTDTSSILVNRLKLSFVGTYETTLAALFRYDVLTQVSAISNSQEESVTLALDYAEILGERIDVLGIPADNDNYTPDVTDLFMQEILNINEFEAQGVSYTDIRNIDDSNTFRQIVLNLTSFNFENELILDNGTEQIAIGNLDSIYGVFSTINVDSTIQVSNATLFGNLGGIKDIQPTSYIHTQTLTYDGNSLQNSRTLTIPTSNPYLDINNFIGVGFLIYDSTTSLLYQTTLNNFTVVDQANSIYDLEFDIFTSDLLQSNSFLRDKNQSCLVTTANLSAAFLNLPEIDKRLAIKGNVLNLAYNQDDFSSIPDKNYIHQFNIANNQINYLSEKEAAINTDVDDSNSYVFRQYVD